MRQNVKESSSNPLFITPEIEMGIARSTLPRFVVEKNPEGALYSSVYMHGSVETLDSEITSTSLDNRR